MQHIQGQQSNQSIEQDLIEINCVENPSLFEAEQKAIKEAELAIERFEMMNRALGLM